MEKIKTLYKKNEEIIVYLIVGVLTTIFSWVACYIAKYFLDSTIGWQNFIINTIGWVAGVCYAYPLNRKWVFKSTNKHIIKEFWEFSLSRLSTLILDLVIMWGLVNSWLGSVVIRGWFEALCSKISVLSEMTDTVHYWFVKIFISAVLVTIANYIFSKFLVFGKKKKKNTSKKENK